MGRFTDNAKNDWDVDISVATIRRIKSVLDVNLLDVAEDGGKLAKRLEDDPVLLIDCLFVCCEKQAAARNVKDVDFGEAMFGDTLEAAANAFWEALVAFFPPAKRRLLEKARQKLKALETKALELCNRRLDSPELAAKLDGILENTKREIDAHFGTPSPSLPASPA